MKTTETKVLAWLLGAVLACGGGCQGSVSPGDDDDTSGHPDAGPHDPDAGPHDPDAGPGHDVQPRLIVGGGVTDAPIAGELNVFVIDGRTGAPIAGAAVRVGAASASTPLTGTTDASGLLVLSGGALAGAQTVTASSAGHAAATWIGVTGANVTLALTPQAAPASASVDGTITGWASMPPPIGLNQYYLALIMYTFLDDLNAPENSIAQPMNGQAPANTCVRTAIDSTCKWRMNARTGAQLHYAVIVKGDAHGTPNDQTDDTYTLMSYAMGTPATLTAGQVVNNEALTLISAGAMTGMQVSFGGTPAGLSDVVAVPMIDLGSLGRAVLPLPTLTPSAASTMIPAAQGVFANGTAEVVSVASPPGTDASPFSIAFARDVSGGQAVLGAFPAPPSGLSAAGGHYGFSPMAGASLHVANLVSAGVPRWSVLVLDGSSSFELPTLSPDPLPGGTLDLVVTGTDMPGFVVGDFTLPAITAGFTHAAGDTVTFSH